MNNVGLVSIYLSATIGGMTVLSLAEHPGSVTMLNGQLVVGGMVFDPSGTIGICTAVDQDEQQNFVYTIRTCATDETDFIPQAISSNY